jgi:hypothetical protein
MTERTTGATDAQIEAADRVFVRRRCPTCKGLGSVNWRGIANERQRCDDCFGRGSVDRELSNDHRIIGPEDIAALRRLLAEYQSGAYMPLGKTLLIMHRADLDRLAALIGDGNA